MYGNSGENAGFRRSCAPIRLASPVRWAGGAGGRGAGPKPIAFIVTFPTENSHPKPSGNLGKQDVKLRHFPRHIGSAGACLRLVLPYWGYGVVSLFTVFWDWA